MRPERPQHPLAGYADAYDYAFNGGMFQSMPRNNEPEHGAIPMVYGQKYPDQKPGPEFLQSPSYAVHRERYGPQYHDRTPELLER